LSKNARNLYFGYEVFQVSGFGVRIVVATMVACLGNVPVLFFSWTNASQEQGRC
jgi:hypothetical protein